MPGRRLLYTFNMEQAQKRRRGKLLVTLIGVLVLVSVLPLLISNWFLIGINRDSLETLEKQYLTRSAVGISSDVDNVVQSYQQQLLKIAGGIQTMSRFMPEGSDPILHPVQNEVIAGYAASDADLLAVRMLNLSGQGAAVQPAGLGADAIESMNRAATAAMSGDPHVGEFQYVSVANQPAIVLAVPVENQSGVIGSVQALVSLRRIADRLRDEARGDVTAFVVDRSGRVLMHSEPHLGLERPVLESHRIVQEYMKAPVRLTETYEEVIDGQRVEMLGTVAPVRSADWGVVVQKDSESAFASVDRMIRQTIQWSLIALVFAVLVGTGMATGITRPLRVLAERTREIAAGHYGERVEVRATNEVGELADHFNVMSSEIDRAIGDLRRAANENHLLFINSIRMLAAAIDAKDPYTRGHSERVARYSTAIGRQMGLSDVDLKYLRISALLHDVGKIGIDDRILRKPGALTEEEFEVMKSHPEKGAAIMGGVPQLRGAIPGMRHHHEKWAGGGYPDGLRGEQIPLQARIVTVADTFDAMTTTRPYQKAMNLNYVVDKIKSFAGTRFDPIVVGAFIKAVEMGEIQLEEQIRGVA